MASFMRFMKTASRATGKTTQKVGSRAPRWAGKAGKAGIALGAGVGVATFTTLALCEEKPTIYGMFRDLQERMAKVEELMDMNSFQWKETMDKIQSVKDNFKDNRMAKHFDFDYFKSLPADLQERLYRCCRTGIENPDSSLGCYAMHPDDYEVFGSFFDAVIRDYHKASADSVHITDWSLDGVEGLPADGQLDVRKLGLPELSMRVRVGRNLADFPLPGAMSKDDRIRFEKRMLKAFDVLIKDPNYGGQVCSLTPDFGNGEANPNKISDDEYKALVKAHIMFKDMAADPYLETAGIANDWPYGRGCYMSADRQCIIWFGEEDQLRIMCMKKGAILNEVFDRLRGMLDTVESIDGINFAHSKKYGYVTSCPTNLGTGMRASVHIKIPNLTADGTDKKAKAVCKPLGLSVRGTGGEHTPIGADGTVDISPSARLFIKEAEIVTALYKGIELLMEQENQ